MQALPQHHRHLYLYHLVQGTSQEPISIYIPLLSIHSHAHLLAVRHHTCLRFALASSPGQHPTLAVTRKRAFGRIYLSHDHESPQRTGRQNTTLRARYVEEQTSAMRDMLRRLSEDVGRLEGIGRAQAQMYARSISDFEKHRQEMDIEQRTLISQVNYLAEEVSPFIVY